MKKRFFCLLMAFAMLSSCLCANATANLQNKSGISVCATNSFNMTVSANTATKATTTFPLVAGETVTIKASYAPFSASVDFGVIAPDGLFYGINTSTGSFDKTIQVTQTGQYTMAVKNNSSTAISVSGYVQY